MLSQKEGSLPGGEVELCSESRAGPVSVGREGGKFRGDNSYGIQRTQAQGWW